MTVITDQNWKQQPQQYGILPRFIEYGSPQARQRRMIPLGDDLDVLVPWDEMKERINQANEKRMMPIHHLEANGAQAHNQGRTNYCWAYGITACVEALRPMENQPFERLGPASLGWLVNWRNAGYYLSETIFGANERGIASAEFVGDGANNPGTFKTGWEDDALNHRPHEWTDTERSNEKYMAQQCASLLVAGLPLYIAYNWWGHALMMAGVVWDESVKYNLRWVAWNSHNDGRIELTGSRGVPDEAYGVRLSTYSP